MLGEIGLDFDTIVQTVQTNFETLVRDDPVLANRYASVLDSNTPAPDPGGPDVL
jgi:hypothetical protein